MSKAARQTKRRRRSGGRTPNYINGEWTGPDVWTTGNGEPSAARLMAEKLGYDWQRSRIKKLFGTEDLRAP